MGSEHSPHNALIIDVYIDAERSGEDINLIWYYNNMSSSTLLGMRVPVEYGVIEFRLHPDCTRDYRFAAPEIKKGTDRSGREYEDLEMQEGSVSDDRVTIRDKQINRLHNRVGRIELTVEVKHPLGGRVRYLNLSSDPEVTNTGGNNG